MKKGYFIVLDGIDGSGKATQTEILVKRLEREGVVVKVVDFPRYGEKSAALVEEYLNGKFGSAEEVGAYRASIFYAVDRYAASAEIKEWLEKGYCVVSNRYVSANKGHQAAKLSSNEEKDKFLDWLDELEYGLFQVPKPDMVLFLYVLAEVGQKLVDKKDVRSYTSAKRDLHEEDINHLKNAELTYNYLVEKYDYWKKIDCMNKGDILSIEEISGKVWNEVKKLL